VLRVLRHFIGTVGGAPTRLPAFHQGSGMRNGCLEQPQVDRAVVRSLIGQRQSERMRWAVDFLALLHEPCHTIEAPDGFV